MYLNINGMLILQVIFIGKIIGNSMSKSNQFYIQRINELEFNPNIIRLGTGELSQS